MACRCNPRRRLNEYRGKDAYRHEDMLRALLLQGLQGDAVALIPRVSEGARRSSAVVLAPSTTGLPDDLEDLVQETLLAVHTQRHTYAHDLPVTAWVYSMASCKLVDLLRRRSRVEARNSHLTKQSTTPSSYSQPQRPRPKTRGMTFARCSSTFQIGKKWLPILHVKLEGLSVAETAVLTGDVRVGRKGRHTPAD